MDGMDGMDGIVGGVMVTPPELGAVVLLSGVTASGVPFPSVLLCGVPVDGVVMPLSDSEG